jgi:isopentenyl diphosphate isomerase/L-lactate dehydrogenase-like FMN-dependent dehydrogenase
VAHVLQIIREEMEVAMGLTGVADVHRLDRSALVDDGRRPPPLPGTPTI